MSSAIGGRRCAWGFSLLEMLAVLVVIGVVATALLLSADLGGARARHADEGRALAALTERMCEEATLLTRSYGMQVSPLAVRFFEFEGEGWAERVADRTYRTRPLTDQAHVTLRVGGRDVTEADPDLPQVVCFSSGEMTPFELELISPAGDRVVLSGDGLGEVRVAVDDDA